MVSVASLLPRWRQLTTRTHPAGLKFCFAMSPLLAIGGVMYFAQDSKEEEENKRRVAHKTGELDAGVVCAVAVFDTLLLCTRRRQGMMLRDANPISSQP
jgi:hypothetical protein